MLHNLRREPLVCKPNPRKKRERLPWEVDMTLCMAAACQENGKHRIVAWADTRSEIDWAGANIAYKHDFVSRPDWRCLIAGDLSKAREIASTFRSVLKPKEFTADNVQDKLTEAACIHKEKLTEQFVRKRLGISFTRFLTKGEKELTAEVRNRTWYAIEHLDFGGSLIIYGFLDGQPHIYAVDGDGEISRRDNFAAIGTGSIIAESMLYYREQHLARALDQTLYHLYEAYLMTYQSKAPSVGETSQCSVLGLDSNGEIEVRLGMSSLMVHLDLSFQKYAPKPVGEIVPWPEGTLIDARHAIAKMYKSIKKQSPA